MNKNLGKNNISSGVSFSFSDGGRDAFGFKNEVRDCTVRAIALTSGVDYKTAHEVMQQRGKRRNKGRANLAKYLPEIQKDLPVTYRLIKRSGSVRALIKEYGQGKILCHVRGHAFAIIDGTIHDLNPVSVSCHVRHAWIVQ